MGVFPKDDYIEAIVPINMNREYIETDIPIPQEDENSIEAEYAIACHILMGVEE